MTTGYEKIEKIAGIYNFYWDLVCSAIYPSNSFGEREAKRCMDLHSERLKKELAERNLKIADIPAGVGKNIDKLKLSVKDRAKLEAQQLSDKFKTKNNDPICSR